MKKILSLLLCLAMLLTLGLTAMGQAEDGGELRVSLCIAETLGDLGFYDSANEGLKRLEADYGVIGSVVECKSDASMYQVALVEAAEQSDVVVAVGWQFWDGLTVVVPEMPDTKFIFVDNGLLREGGYLTVEDGGWLHLTELGFAAAEKIYERHRVLTLWLTRIGVSRECAAEDACRIEHVISAESFAAIKAHVQKHDAE